MELSNLTKLKSINRSKKRIGRGAGSGKGFHTSSKGNKGQNARSGGKKAIGFEGGQLPLIKRLPFLGGFRNVNKSRVYELTLSDIFYADAEKLDANEILADINRMNKKFDEIKILSSGEFESDKKIELIGFKYAKKAKDKLEKHKSVKIID